jgi:large repetitive protein
MSATLRRRMGGSGSRAIRVAFVAALVAVMAAAAASVAYSMAFDDGSPCPDRHPLFVCPSGAVGASYSIQLAAHGGCTPYKFANSSGSLPPGLSLTSSGLISGTPTASGTWTPWLQLISHCAGDPTADRQFSFTIDSGLRILTNTLPAGASVGLPYSVTLDVQLVTNLNPLTGSTPNSGALTWSVISGALPPGLTLSNGVISGTPTTEGSYTFQVHAALDATRKHFQTYSLTVRQPLAIAATKPLATPPLPTAWEVGVPFSAKLTPSGGSATYAFNLKDGTLPTGVTLGADGALAGTPRAAGVFRATVTLSDNEGRTLDYALSFGVAKPLAVSTLTLKPGKVGRLYRAKLASTGGLPPKKWKVLTGPLPKGIRFTPALGTLSGTPTKAGSYRVAFQVTDGLNVVAKRTLRIVVAL